MSSYGSSSIATPKRGHGRCGSWLTTRAEVTATERDDTLSVEIRDDGISASIRKGAVCPASPIRAALGGRLRLGRALPLG